MSGIKLNAVIQNSPTEDIIVGSLDVINQSDDVCFWHEYDYPYFAKIKNNFSKSKACFVRTAVDWLYGG